MSARSPATTIFALSSGAPPAAIAIIRISGPAAGVALRLLAGRIPPPRCAAVATLRNAAGEVLDQSLTLWFPGPGSATGEDLAELHLHGGRAVVAGVMDALGGLDGCRPALPGEFTRRAFVNGRIDLLQADGLADLLQAESAGARRRALRVAEGGLSRVVEEWRDRLLHLAARAEAVLEFGADDPDIAGDAALAADVAGLARELEATMSEPPAERLRDGLRVVVAGPPNAGKSTLVNALAGREVALATPIPGTTRDLVEAPLLLAGEAMILVDSAGLRASVDAVERLGIARAESAIAAADLVLWLGDPAEQPRGVLTITVHARCDEAARGTMPVGADVAVSAVTGAGMPALRERIVTATRALLPPEIGWMQEHRAWIAEAAAALRRAEMVGDEILVAEELRAALDALDSLSGRRNVEAMLDRLFARFCVGK